MENLIIDAFLKSIETYKLNVPKDKRIRRIEFSFRDDDHGFYMTDPLGLCHKIVLDRYYEFEKRYYGSKAEVEVVLSKRVDDKDEYIKMIETYFPKIWSSLLYAHFRA